MNYTDTNLIVEVTYKGVDFEILGTYHKEEPQTYEYPGYPAHFDIEEIKIGDYNMLPLLDDYVIECLEELCVERF